MMDGASRRLDLGGRDRQRREEAILEAAFVEFADHGFAGARIDRIAARAGCDKVLIYRYFGNKAALFEELLRRKLGVVNEARRAEPRPLGDELASWAEAVAADPRWLRLLLWEALSWGAGPIVAEEARRAGWHEVIAQLRAEQATGRIAPELDARQLELHLVALATFPAAFPQFTSLITGLDVADPAFEEQRATFLAALGARLTGSASLPPYESSSA